MIRDTLTFIPGPTPVHREILDALARPTTSHQAPEFVEAFRAALADLRVVARASAAQPFVVAGAGTLAMEMALVNLLAPRDRLLVVSHGYFGDRFGELATAFGIDCTVERAEWGRVIEPAVLERRLSSADWTAVALTHVDTSTGVAAPVAEYCRTLAGRGLYVILDGVCATGGMDERFDDWGIDVLLTGAQKALGTPPGLAILLASVRALERRRSRPSITAYYADLLRWLPVMEDPTRYFSTPAVNEIVALGVGLRLAREEGLDVRFARHHRLALGVRAGLAALGFQPFTDERHLADTLSVMRYPPGLDDARFRAEVVARGIVLAGGLGPVAGQVFRVGHMGNIGAGEVCALLHAVENALGALGQDVRAGSSVEAAARHL